MTLFRTLAALLIAATPSLIRTATATPSAPPASGVTGVSPDLPPGLKPEVMRMALSAMQCAQASGIGSDARTLAVIDYSRPSLQQRLWVFDIRNDRLLYQEVVAHGQGSGENLPSRFSNDDGTHASSLGLFLTANTYEGHNGYSLRMRGLEPGINDNAMQRAIVVHGAAYVNPVAGQAMGRLGRSWGCPAVRTAVARPLIDSIKDGQFVFAYYPDPQWLRLSRFIHCNAAHRSS